MSICPPRRADRAAEVIKLEKGKSAKKLQLPRTPQTNKGGIRDKKDFRGQKSYESTGFGRLADIYGFRA